MSELTDLEKKIMNTVRENKKPLTIAELKEKLFGYAPPHPDFYHDLNYLMIYRRILKTVTRNRNGFLFECTPSTFNKHVRQPEESKDAD